MSEALRVLLPTKNKSVPIFAVPTTAGTAAEVTINYVITDVEKNRKMVCVDPTGYPGCCICRSGDDVQYAKGT